MKVRNHNRLTFSSKFKVFHQNVSKFAIFLCIRKLCRQLFSVFILCNFTFFLLNAAWSLATQTRAFIWEKLTLHKMKNEKITRVFMYMHQIYTQQNLKSCFGIYHTFCRVQFSYFLRVSRRRKDLTNNKIVLIILSLLLSSKKTLLVLQVLEVLQPLYLP